MHHGLLVCITWTVLSIASFAWADSEKLAVYIEKYVAQPLPEYGKHDFASIAQGVAAGAVEGIGRGMKEQALGQLGGSAAALLWDLARPVDYSAPKYAVVVGADVTCQPIQITFPFRNLHWPRDGDKEAITNAVAPLRWVLVSRNEAGEIQVDPLVDKASVRTNPCWSKYVNTVKAKGGTFDPETYYR